MKKLFLLLLLINLSLFTYFNMDTILPSVHNSGMATIEPDKIMVLTQQQIEALPKKSSNSSIATVTPPTTSTSTSKNMDNSTVIAKSAVSSGVCYEWGVFSATNLTRAKTEVSALSLPATVKEQSALEAKRFWVYKPPLKSAESAQAKAIELKALGIEELFVVQDEKWKNAISFGIFEDERLANNLIRQLKTKGVNGVVKTIRNQGKGHSSLKFSPLTDAEVIELKKLKSKFPEADVKQVSCS